MRLRWSAAVAAVLFALPAFGITATSSITGRIVSAGKPAARVIVTVTSPALQGERSTETMPNGRYFLTALPPGRYEVTFSRAGLQSLTRRTLVELGRVARVDAALEPSEDEESITATAINVSVADMTAPTTHFSDLTLDHLPVRRAPHDAMQISGGAHLGGGHLVDDVPSARGFRDPFEPFEEFTILRGGLPPEFEWPAPYVLARTRRGGEELTLTLRDTVTSSSWVWGEPEPFDDGVQHLTEAAAGGRIIPEKLWFYTSAWAGEELFIGKRSGILGTLTAQLGAHNNVSLTHDLSDHESEYEPEGMSETALRYTGTGGRRLTGEVTASYLNAEGWPGQTTLFAKSTYVLPSAAGAHVLSVGGDLFEAGDYEFTTFFVNDRWILQRWTINAGLRRDGDDSVSPRLGASYDLRGNGRHALVANFGDYHTNLHNFTRELTLGYAAAVGNSGTVRVDLLRRELRGVAADGAQADFAYSLFDRFQTGANYTWHRPAERNSSVPEHSGNAWFTLELPAGENELAVTLLERYVQFEGDHFLTDVALRYVLPLFRTTVTAAVDVLNLLDERDIRGRELRAWLRVGL